MRISLMEDPRQRERLAKLYADGLSRPKMAKEFGVHPDTISGWAGREDVQKLVTKYVRERTNRVLRHTDSRIEGVLTSGADLSLDELLKIRREFNTDKGDSGGEDKSDAIAELMKELHRNPEAAKRLRDGKA